MKHVLIAATLIATPAAAQELRPDQKAFRALYEELVNTNTAFSNGSCTLAAERLAARMKAAGFADGDVQVITAPGKPREGSLVARFPGTSKMLKPMLLLAHIDVVEARREDWTRDPFTLIEENGFFYGRGVSDDKSQAAIWVDTLIRFKQEGYRPKRMIKLAATCGEESNGVALNGAEWLARNRPELISAEFAFNEGGGGRVDPSGKPQILSMQVGEKATRTFFLEATNPGGHSSMPRPDNAIYELTAAIGAVQRLQFPVMLNDTTRQSFRLYAAVLPPEKQQAVTRLLANEKDGEAAAMLATDPIFNSTMRTTCVTTMLDAGHAPNALPQRAKATVNCRIVPGMTAEQTQDAIRSAIANPKISITLQTPFRPMAVPPPLDPRIMEPARELGVKLFPGVPFIPTMATGATDATYTGLLGIPTYGVPGILFEGDGGGIHGLNERLRVKSLYDGRDYLYLLVKRAAER